MRRPSTIQSKELKSQFFRMLGLDARLRPRSEEFLDSAVPEALNHFSYSVSLLYTTVKADPQAEGRPAVRQTHRNRAFLAFGDSVSWCRIGSPHFFHRFPQQIPVVHSFCTKAIQFSLEADCGLRHIAYTQARKFSVWPVHRESARRFPVVLEGELPGGFQGA